MPAPRRHNSTSRNRRKSVRLAHRIRGELEFLWVTLNRRLGNIKYALRKADKLINRLAAERREHHR